MVLKFTDSLFCTRIFVRPALHTHLHCLFPTEQIISVFLCSFVFSFPFRFCCRFVLLFYGLFWFCLWWYWCLFNFLFVVFFLFVLVWFFNREKKLQNGYGLTLKRTEVFLLVRYLTLVHSRTTQCCASTAEPQAPCRTEQKMRERAVTASAGNGGVFLFVIYLFTLSTEEGRSKLIKSERSFGT